MIKMSQDNVDILNSIYKNSKMASECIRHVSSACQNSQFKEYIEKQGCRYEQNCAKIADEIRSQNGRVEDVPSYEKIMAKMGIDMKTMFDKNDRKAAELMYNGTNMGIVDIARTVNRAKDADQQVLDEAERLLSAEEQYADGLKRFL